MIKIEIPTTFLHHKNPPGVVGTPLYSSSVSQPPPRSGHHLIHLWPSFFFTCFDNCMQLLRWLSDLRSLAWWGTWSHTSQTNSTSRFLRRQKMSTCGSVCRVSCRYLEPSLLIPSSVGSRPSFSPPSFIFWWISDHLLSLPLNLPYKTFMHASFMCVRHGPLIHN